MVNHRAVKGLFLAIAWVFISSKTVFASDPGAISPNYGGTLTIGTEQIIKSVNPLVINNSASQGAVSLIYSKLIRINEQGLLEPEVADRWSLSDDGLVYTFYLRTDVFFHDGVRLTSEDVVFTLQKIKDLGPDCPISRSFDLIEEVSTPSADVVVVRLSKPSAPFICQFVQEILPKHIYKKNQSIADFENQKPVGSGPFTFGGIKGNTVVLEANSQYFEGRPYLDQVLYKTYPDKNQVWSALMRHEIDMMVFMKVDDYEVTKKDSSFDTFAYPGPERYVLSYNIHDPIMSDINLRKALSLAIDRPKIIDTVDHGYGSPSYSLFEWGALKDRRSFSTPYDPSKAIDILSHSGWSMDELSGTLKNGSKNLEINLLIEKNGDPKLTKIAQVLHQQFQEIGIKLKLTLYDPSDVTIKIKNYQGYLGAYYGRSVDPDEIVKVWHSQDYRKHLGIVFQGPSKKIDRLIELGRVARSPRFRNLIYRNIQNHVYQNRFHDFLYYPYIFHATFRNIKNSSLYLNFFMPDQNIRKMSNLSN